MEYGVWSMESGKVQYEKWIGIRILRLEVE